jgi:hypothetical protein
MAEQPGEQPVVMDSEVPGTVSIEPDIRLAEQLLDDFPGPLQAEASPFPERPNDFARFPGMQFRSRQHAVMHRAISLLMLQAFNFHLGCISP